LPPERPPFTSAYAAIYDHIGQAALAAQVAARLLESAAVPTGPACRVLDLACGTGAAAVPMAAAGCEVIGIDQSPAMLEQARHQARQRRLSLHLIEEDITCLQDSQHHLLLPQSFDVVLALQALNYLTGNDALSRLCRDVARLLRPGGLFVCDMLDAACLAQHNEHNFILHNGHDYVAYTILQREENGHTLQQRVVWLVREIEQWWRSEETHQQRLWQPAHLHKALRSAGDRRGASLRLLHEEAASGKDPLPRIVYAACKTPLPEGKSVSRVI
jgi:SAM-dependent methyltransferase